MTVTAHGKTREGFARDLAAAVHDQGLTPRTAVVRAGPWAYRVLLQSQEDGPHTTLPNVGWVALEEDRALEAWTTEVVAKEAES
jgi:hypothetical protein